MVLVRLETSNKIDFDEDFDENLKAWNAYLLRYTWIILKKPEKETAIISKQDSGFRQLSI